MNWLFKEEPESYSFDDLERDGKTSWEGVRNNLALIHLRQVKKGDQIYFYHTGDEKSVVGIMRANDDAFSKERKVDLGKSKEIAVTVSPIRKLRKPVTLQEIKSDSKLKNLPLVRISRLSVMPVTKEEWDEILRLSEK